MLNSTQCNIGVPRQENALSPTDFIALDRESRYFHKCLFNEEAEQSFVELYRAVHLEQANIFASSDREIACVARIVAKRLDAVGIEPCLRRRCERRHLLSRKLMLATYLAEADGQHLAKYGLQERQSWCQLWCRIFIKVAGGSLRLTRGFIQAIRHDLF